MRGAPRLGVQALAALTLGAVLVDGCTSSSSASGLELTLDALGLTPEVDFDEVGLVINQQGPDGSWLPDAYSFTSPLAKSRLPQTFTVTTGTSANEVARIRFTGYLRSKPVVLREVIVQLPHGQVDNLELTLAKSCLHKVTAEGTSTCTTPVDGDPYSCQPGTGACGPDLTVSGMVTPVPDAGHDATVHHDAGTDTGMTGPADARDAADVRDAGTDAPKGVDAGADVRDTGPPDARPGGSPSDATCGDAPCTVIAAAASSPEALAVDNHYVYWSSVGSNVIRVCPIGDSCDGGAAYATATTGREVRALDVQEFDGGGLMWVESSSDAGRIQVCMWPSCKGGPQPQTTTGIPTSLTNDGTSLYWTAETDHSVHFCPLETCPAGSGSFPSSPGAPSAAPPLAVTTDAVNVDWVDPGYAILSHPTEPQEAGATRLADAGSGVTSLVIGNSCLFWLDVALGQVLARKFGVGVTTLASPAAPSGLVFWDKGGEEYVAFGDDATGTITMVDATGCAAGTVTVIAHGLTHPRALVIDVPGTYLYWTEDGNAGAAPVVRRMPVP